MAKKVVHFTQARIKALSIPYAGRVEYYDDEEKRLICRVSSTGNKTYNVVKWVAGKVQRVTIGNADDYPVDKARKKAKDIVSDLNAGINPTEQKRKHKAAQTKLVDVMELYLSDRALKPYTIKDYRYKLKLGFADWLQKPINDITETMVLKRHKEITSGKGKTTANTTMRVLRLTMNYAKAVGMIEQSPTKIISETRSWHKSQRKDRVIPSNQLQAWHKAVEALPNDLAKVYLLMALYMGFRSSELLTLEWTHVDLKGQKITLYDTKNRSNHCLPIPNYLLSYLDHLNTLADASKWVFAGRNPEKHMEQPRVQMRAVTKASGVEFSPHDCRRTFATIAEAVNLPLTMIKRLMNHTTTNDVTGGYIVTEEETLREAINKVADYIQARVTPKDNVIKLHG